MDSYEKKYKEMKARVLEIGQGYVKGVDFSKPRQIAEYIDPELVESDDEKIRKSLVNYINAHGNAGDFTKENFIAWLEKAVTPTPQDWNDYKDKPVEVWNAYVKGLANGVERGKEAVKNSPQYYGLAKQGEPKSTSWKPTKEQYGALDYAFNCCPDTELGNYFEGVLSTLIEDLHKLENQSEQKPDKVEPRFHEGDLVVVSNTKGDRVVQIASVEYFKDGHPSYITTEGRWFGNGTKARLLTNKDVETTTIPESRINVSKNKSWSEEDDKLLKLSLENLTELKKRFGDGYGKVGDCIYWLKSVKNRIQPKQEWSEEDEAMFQGVIETEQYMLDVVYGRKIFAVGNEDIKEECTKELSWLKSLKDRIK